MALEKKNSDDVFVVEVRGECDWITEAASRRRVNVALAFADESANDVDGIVADGKVKRR